MQFVPVSKLSEKQKIWILNFVLKHEYFCVQLSSKIKDSYKDFYAVFTDEISKSNLFGIISAGKSVLHILPFINSSLKPVMLSDFEASCSAFFSKILKTSDAPYALNGTKQSSEVILRVLKRNGFVPSQINEYKLMILRPDEFSGIKPENFKNGEQIIRCKKNIEESDFEKLFQLQTEYEKSEVVPEFQEFNPDLCRLKLKTALRKQCVLALKTIDERFAAKAATNAIGFKFVQLGGIYTSTEFRHRHYAINLLYALIKKICGLKRIPVLFVKTTNIGALMLYKKLAFAEFCDYTIAYFKMS